MVNLTPNPSYSVNLRIELPNRSGTLATVTNAIASEGGSFGQISLIESTLKITQREITVNASSAEHAERIVDAVKALEDVKLISRNPDLRYTINVEATDANFFIGRTSSAEKFISRRSPSFLAIVASLRGLSAKKLFNLDEWQCGGCRGCLFSDHS